MEAVSAAVAAPEAALEARVEAVLIKGVLEMTEAVVVDPPLVLEDPAIGYVHRAAIITLLIAMNVTDVEPKSHQVLEVMAEDLIITAEDIKMMFQEAVLAATAHEVVLEVDPIIDITISETEEGPAEVAEIELGIGVTETTMIEIVTETGIETETENVIVTGIEVATIVAVEALQEIT